MLKRKVIAACVLTTIIVSLFWLLANAIGIFDLLKRNAILKQLGIPVTSSSCFAAYGERYDFLHYTDEYRWAVIKLGDPEDIKAAEKSISSNEEWHFEQIGREDILTLMKLIPGDYNHINTMIPLLSSSFDVWYFAGSNNQQPMNFDDLKLAARFVYTIAFLDADDGYLWFYDLKKGI